MPPFYRQISLSQDWLDFFEFQFKCYCLFMLLREKDQKVFFSYEMLLLSEKLFQKYGSAALMIQIVNIDKSEDVSVFLRVGKWYLEKLCFLGYEVALVGQVSNTLPPLVDLLMVYSFQKQISMVSSLQTIFGCF